MAYEAKEWIAPHNLEAQNHFTEHKHRPTQLALPIS
jgi:hypothetical protein